MIIIIIGAILVIASLIGIAVFQNFITNEQKVDERYANFINKGHKMSKAEFIGTVDEVCGRFLTIALECGGIMVIIGVLDKISK